MELNVIDREKLTNHFENVFLENYEEIFSKLVRDFNFDINTQLDFDRNENSFACINIETNKINFNATKYIGSNFYNTVIHEFAHAICKKYEITNGHTWEFAIMQHVLEEKYLVLNKFDFRHYNISDEESLTGKEIVFDLNGFENLIKSIKYGTLEELAHKCKRIANKIRKRLETRQKIVNQAKLDYLGAVFAKNLALKEYLDRD